MAKIPDDVPDVESLAEARAWLNEQVETGEGGRCPCCDQFAKVYLRKLNSSIAHALIRCYQRHALDWFHAPSLVRDCGDFAKARYWGLVEEANALRPDGGRAGVWRVTVQGERFVLGRLWVPSHARVYNGGFLGLDNAKQIDIRDALGRHFSYVELMAESAPGAAPLAGAG